MSPDPDREIYPSAPLRFVAFELRYPPVSALSQQPARERLYEALRTLFPITQAAPTIELPLAPLAPVNAVDQLRLLDRARSRSVTVGPASLLVETSAYERYEVFTEWLSLALSALASLDAVAAVERIGLRYIDEIRIDGVATPTDWQPFIDPALHGPLKLVEPYIATTTQAAVEYTVSDRQRLVMRYGAGHGWVVNPDGVLRLNTRDDGPYFLIDLDSFWLAPDELPELDANEAVKIAGDLHAPIRTAFEAAITNKLRDEVLRRPA
jgi:uncharacterized protein (TIGR04255 family)